MKKEDFKSHVMVNLSKVTINKRNPFEGSLLQKHVLYKIIFSFFTKFNHHSFKHIPLTATQKDLQIEGIHIRSSNIHGHWTCKVVQIPYMCRLV